MVQTGSQHNTFSTNASLFDQKQMLIDQGLKWYHDASHRKLVFMPKLNRQNRTFISSGLKSLFEHELIPIIDRYNPSKWLDIEDDLRWHLFEVLHCIRVHIMIKLNKNPDKLYAKHRRKPWINHDQSLIANIQYKTKRLNSLAADDYPTIIESLSF